jgi:DNA replication initiation complex subunit (GINS family)
MITYNDIYEAAKKEGYSEQLQVLSKTFVEDVSEYLKDKKEISSRDDDFSDMVIKTKKQLENAQTLFKELMLKRRKKILNLLLIAAETGVSKKDFDNMLDFEKELFEELMVCIDSSNKKVLESFNWSGRKEENLSVLFKEDVDEFIDFDGNKLGPFKKGDNAELPREIVKILIEDGKIV